MKGFDVEFRDLDHYIRVITDRIWEGRRLDDIHRYYSPTCAVETPAAVSIGVQAVIDGTRATLLAFPDRRLLAEDVIVSGDEQGGFLSSHRIFSPMTHAGPGAFGPASGKPVFARTIADCVCLDNRIVHEWLVRDQAAIARQTGQHEREVALVWLNERGGLVNKAAMPAAPAAYRSFVDTDPLARHWADTLQALWLDDSPTLLARVHAPQVIAHLPAAQVAVGRSALHGFWQSLRQSLRLQSFTVEHLVAHTRPGRPAALALRWRAQTLHEGGGRYAAATGHAVEVLGISHAEAEGDGIVREWHLIDDVALWMQVLQRHAH